MDVDLRADVKALCEAAESFAAAHCEDERAFDLAQLAIALRARIAEPREPPTEFDEPPWPGWFSCEDCQGWFNAEGVAYDSGSVVCDACAAVRDEPSDEDVARELVRAEGADPDDTSRPRYLSGAALLADALATVRAVAAARERARKGKEEG